MLSLGNQPTLRVLKNDAVPHVFAWTRSGSVATRNRMHSAQKRRARQEQQEKAADKAYCSVAQEEVVHSVDIQFGK